MELESWRVIVYYETHLGTPPAEIHRRLVQVFGDGVVSFPTVASWAARYRAGETTLEDRPRSGRPPIQNLPARVKELLDETPFMSAHAIADQLGVSWPTVLNVLRNDLNFVWRALRWVPHALSDADKAKRVSMCSSLFEHLRSLGPRSADRIITGDQTWVSVLNEHSHIWMSPDAEAPICVRTTMATRKIMVTVLFTRRRLLVVDILPQDRTFNAPYMVETILPALEAEVCKTSPMMRLRGWALHLDNATPHRARLTKRWLSDNNLTILDHPPYSPDVAPSDFGLFGILKERLKGLEVSGTEDLEEKVKKLLGEFPESLFTNLHTEWLERLEWVATHGGEYYTK